MKYTKWCTLLFCTLAFATYAASPIPQENSSSKIRVINFKYCVENSKLGKQEQASFDSLKKQMEKNLSDKEKNLNEMANKFEDPDYIDNLSLEAETEMKRKFRTLNQEYSQLQNQYLQALQQTNIKVLQKLNEAVEKAASNYAKQNNLEVLLNSEGTFYFAPSLDVSSNIVAILDANFEKESPPK